MATMFLCSSCGKFHYILAGKAGDVEADIDPRLCISCAEKMVKCEQCGYFYASENMMASGECFPCYIENTRDEISIDVPIGEKPLREIVMGWI